MEERTGLGGGFNERGEVEYNSHDSDNDEYDDFGRKKKKFRSAGKYIVYKMIHAKGHYRFDVTSYLKSPPFISDTINNEESTRKKNEDIDAEDEEDDGAEACELPLPRPDWLTAATS